MSKTTHITDEKISELLESSKQRIVPYPIFDAVKELSKEEISYMAHALFKNQEFIKALFIKPVSMDVPRYVKNNVISLFNTALLTLIRSLNNLSKEETNMIINCIESLKKETSPMKKYSIRYIYSVLMLYNTKVFPVDFTVESIKRLISLEQKYWSEKESYDSLLVQFFRFIRNKAENDGIKILLPAKVVQSLNDSTLESLINLAIKFEYRTKTKTVIKPLIDIHFGTLKQILQTCKNNHLKNMIDRYLYLINKNNIYHLVNKFLELLNVELYYSKETELMKKIFELSIHPEFKTELILFFDKYRQNLIRDTINLSLYKNEILHYQRVFIRVLKSLQDKDKNLSTKIKKGENNVIRLPFESSSNYAHA